MTSKYCRSLRLLYTVVLLALLFNAVVLYMFVAHTVNGSQKKYVGQHDDQGVDQHNDQRVLVRSARWQTLVTFILVEFEEFLNDVVNTTHHLVTRFGQNSVILVVAKKPLYPHLRVPA